jgi:murein DD-endopeptidase MepM/ murein hydrolase activator NlpD
MQISGSTTGGGLMDRSLEELRGRKDPEAVKTVAREMESLFAYELIKSMRAAEGMAQSKGMGADTYQSMFDMELAKLFSERGLGLQDMLLKGIEQKTGPAAVAGQSPPTGGVAAQEPSAPVEHARISSGFGLRHDPFTGEMKFHHGIDLAAPEGSEVTPFRPGKVIFSGQQSGYGNVVMIDHGDGLVTKYAHNRENLVQEGDMVSRTTVIARVGSTGRSTGPHLHFEVLYKGRDIDPAAVLAKK